MSSDKNIFEEINCDPWGRRRNPDNWSYNNVPAPQITDRGFTGHEHLDDFGLINMNGRMYDPVLGRFLGADPVVTDYNSSQAYNGYSYCINNPLNKTDPTGFTYYKLNADNEWVAFEYNPFGGGEANFRIASNGGICEDRSPGFEENMTSKGYVYVRNQYGIGRWVKKNSDEDDPASDGDPTIERGGFISASVFYSYMLNHARNTPVEVAAFELKKNGNIYFFELPWIDNDATTSRFTQNLEAYGLYGYLILQLYHTHKDNPVPGDVDRSWSNDNLIPIWVIHSSGRTSNYTPYLDKRGGETSFIDLNFFINR